jgi:CRP/FNR family transcriptional activator FtrB
MTVAAITGAATTGRAPLTEEDRLRVRGITLLAGLPRDAVMELLSGATAVTVPAMHELFAQDQAAAALLVVIEGTVGLMAEAGGTEPCLVDLVGPGQVVGEGGLFDDGRQPMAARTVTAARLAMIPAPVVMAALAAHPVWRRHMLAFLSRRLRALVGQIARLKLMTTAQRLGAFLLGLAGRHTGPQTIQLACERRLIARMLGMSPESLSRALLHLRDLGVSSSGRHALTIADPDRLHRFVVDDPA